jgi:hypothetical protein
VSGLAEIVEAFGGAYRETYGSRMPWRHVKALSDIAASRTPALGGQVYVCRKCSATRGEGDEGAGRLPSGGRGVPEAASLRDPGKARLGAALE